MATSIDPYRQWLSIDDMERPPNHYCLLGLALFEGDPEIIWAETMHRMAVVLEHDPGPHCELARQLFDELEMARSCLSDPRRKKKYDDCLRQHLKNLEEQAEVNTNVVGLGASGRRAASQPGGRQHATSSLLCEPASSGAATVGSPVRGGGRLSRNHSLQNHSLTVAALAVIAALVAVAVSGVWNHWEPAEVDQVGPLLVQLTSRDSGQRLAAARALCALGPQAHQATAELLRRLREDTSDEVRVAAAEALVACGGSNSVSVAEVDQILSTELDPAVRAILEPLASGAAPR
jgi:HEAT repeat protein